MGTAGLTGALTISTEMSRFIQSARLHSHSSVTSYMYFIHCSVNFQMCTHIQ